MLIPALRRFIQSVFGVLRQPLFWESLLGMLFLVVLLGTFLVFAVARYDAFLRLHPLICAEGLGERQFYIVAMASPIAILFLLVAVGEMWGQLESRRAGRPMRWFHLVLFSGLATGLGILILFALGC